MPVFVRKSAFSGQRLQKHGKWRFTLLI